MLLEAQQLGDTGLPCPAPPATSEEKAELSLSSHSEEKTPALSRSGVSHTHIPLQARGCSPLPFLPWGLTTESQTLTFLHTFWHRGLDRDKHGDGNGGWSYH